MAVTVISSAHSLAAKLWSKTLMRDTMAKTWYRKLMGEGSNSVIQILPETNRSKGDKITYGLRMQLSGTGKTGQSVLEGEEEELSFYSASLFIDYMRHAVRVDLSISQQRTEYDLRREARDALSDWWAKRIDTYLFNYLAGDTNMTFAGNTGTAPDSDHWIFPTGVSAENTITTSNVFTLSMIDEAVLKAKTASPLIRPVRVDGDDYWVVILHPKQVHDLRTSTASGSWLDLQKAAMTGQGQKDNPIWKGSLGTYNGCIIYESNNVHSGGYGATGTTVYRALLLGAQAGVVAFGQQGGVDQFSWVEKTFDYGKDLGIAASLIWGVQKTIFNNKAYATLVLSSASSA